MSVLCSGDCHVFLGSSSLCTCKVAMYGYPAPYNPFSPHAPLSAPEVPLERLQAAARAGARWLSADGERAYCERLGDVLVAEWDGEMFNSWWPADALPGDAVVLK